MMNLPPYALYITAFAGALLISLLAAPQIISVAGRRQLFDVPDNDRKLHKKTTPSLGGVAIFFAYIIVTSLVVQPGIFDKWHYMVASSLLFFLTGLMDDLVALGAWKKLVAQLIPIFIIVIPGDVRIHSLYGLFSIGELSYETSVFITIFSITFFTNAFNFIDGIDGLAGGMGILCTLILGFCLAITGNIGAAAISFSLAGATAGFLWYNITPARLFMGDTGSLLLGFTISALSVLFINSYDPDTDIVNWIQDGQLAIIFCLALMSLPIADCLRVFFIRMSKGISPMRADRNHLHYFLLDTGLKDLQAVAVILSMNALIVLIAFLMQDLGSKAVFITISIAAAIFFTIVFLIRRRQKRIAL
jgi:UDP-N-acetylmuramyl pentapeptide phosphotransferase/UDP-N-acetylglucosamine-1-phosphate transferase